MLLANMAVAHKIHRAFPEQALLRRHPPPQTKMLNDLVEFCDQMGLPMDFSSAGALNVSAGNMGAGEALLGKAGGRPGSQGSAANCIPPGSLALQPGLPCKGDKRPWGQGLHLAGPGGEPRRLRGCPQA
jgi:hypothetical protein